MPYIETEQITDLPPQKMWEVVDDFANISKFHPLVADSQLLAGEATAKDGERSCTFGDGQQIRERLLEYEEGKSYKVQIIEFGKFPLKEAIVSIGVRATTDPNSSVVFMTNNFKPKFGGWLMGTIMKGQFNKLNKKIIDFAVHYAKTGEKKEAVK